MLVKVEKEGDGMKDHYQNNLLILKDGDHVKKKFWQTIPKMEDRIYFFVVILAVNKRKK